MISVTPLLSFGEALGISSDVWEKREELEYITYTDSNFSQEKAKELTIDLIIPLQEAYGNALSCIFYLGDYPVLDINKVTDDSDLEEFRKFTKDSTTLIFDFTLDKKQLILNKIGNVPECHLFLYFFSKALLRLLASSLSELEISLWESASESSYKVVLFVLNHKILLNGTYLAVLGGEETESWREVISKPSKKTDEQIWNMYKTCQRNLYWQVPWLKQLTPLHLNMNERIPLEDPISKALLIHQINLIMLYTASRTTGNQNNPILSIYTGTNQSVEITFWDQANQIEDKVLANASYLTDMLGWIYNSEWSEDRLSFVQIVVARTLCNADPLVRYQVFLYNAENIFKELKWHWRSFIEGKVDSYISQVNVLEDYVASTVQKFADQITGINRSLFETTLAAVGALIGSFIAALLKNTFNPQIFTTGMLAYAFYVLFFPLLYNMKYQWEQYKVVCNNFEERKKRFEERLYFNKVNEIVGEQITDSKDRFEKWFKITVGIYLIIFVLAIITAFLLPGFIQNTTLSIQNTTVSVV